MAVPVPDFSFEGACKSTFVFGLDEVGRAPLAGPVTAACVYISKENKGKDIWGKVRDSKALSKKKREELFPVIQESCIWAIAEASVKEIETINIVQASFLAMKRAYKECTEKIEVTKGQTILALIDGNLAPPMPCSVQTIIKGDSKSVSIAAASILAKVSRDRLMEKYAKIHPHYSWESNSGYPTPAHLKAIDEFGITGHHRKTFAPVRNYIEFGQVKRQIKFAI